MDDRVIQFRVGVVVVAAIIITAVMIVFFGEGFHRQYTIYVDFARAPGVSVDTPVRKSGVLIGRVAHVELLERGGVQITARIDTKYTLRTNEVCLISTASLFGDAVLDFVPSSEGGGPSEVVRPGEYLQGKVSSDPLQVLVDLQGKASSTLETVQGAGSQVAVLAENLNSLVAENDTRLEEVLQKTGRAMDDFHGVATRLNGVLGDEDLNRRLKETLDAFPQMFDDARGMLGDARRTLQNFDRMSQRAEKNLANLEQFTEPLGEQGPRLVENFDRSVANLDQLLAELLQFSQSLNRGEGTLGKLVSDRQLYEKLDRAADNIEEASRRLQPILADVRVFTDKIATDPRQLGVKGMLDRRPIGTGLKSAVFPTW